MNDSTTKPDDPSLKPCTAFDGHRRLIAGPLRSVALIVKAATDIGEAGQALIYDDADGRIIDVDLRGSAEEVVARLSQAQGPSPHPGVAPPAGPAQAAAQAADSGEPRGRGRPKLGVVAREVTLLPRHWEWLGRQPGGASVALRKLVEAARRENGEPDCKREAREAAYRVMSALAGNLPGFEEASRALFAEDRQRFEALIGGWPQDVSDYVARLAYGAPAARSS